MPEQRHIAWITGGGRGIGHAAALALAGAGCDVALTSRSAGELRDAAEACRRQGARAWEAPCDVTDAKGLEAAYEEIRAKLGPPDVLVNAAGVARSASFLKTTAELMDMHWRVNVLSAFHAARLAVPAMLERRWGRIINVASIAGKTGAPYITAYATSKHAMLGLTRSLAAEYATKGITANAVCPGYVNTRMTRESAEVIVRETGRSPEEVMQRIRAMSPQNRLIEPEEVASVILHLARPDAGGINGQAITIDGGGIQW